MLQDGIYILDAHSAVDNSRHLGERAACMISCYDVCEIKDEASMPALFRK